MGRIKTAALKRVARQLYQAHADKFKADFSHNKRVVTKLIQVRSKKLRNVLAGYITRLKRRS